MESHGLKILITWVSGMHYFGAYVADQQHRTTGATR